MSRDRIHWLQRIAPQPAHVGYGSIRGGWLDSERMIFDHQLFCNRQGGPFDIEIESEIYSIEENHFLIIPPGRFHTRRNVGKQPAQRAWVHFDWMPVVQSGQWLGTVYAGGRINEDHIHYQPDWIPDQIFKGPIANPRHFFERHRILNDAFNQGTPRERFMARGLFLELLLSLLTPAEMPAMNAAVADRAYAIRSELALLAEEPFYQADSIRARLASRGQSYDHQARIFKKTFGITPLQYVNSLRMTRAKRLLAETNWPVQVVAEHLGFRDLTYFDRLFRKCFNCSPSTYRHRIRSKC